MKLCGNAKKIKKKNIKIDLHLRERKHSIEQSTELNMYVLIEEEEETLLIPP